MSGQRLVIIGLFSRLLLVPWAERDVVTAPDALTRVAFAGKGSVTLLELLGGQVLNLKLDKQIVPSVTIYIAVVDHSFFGFSTGGDFGPGQDDGVGIYRGRVEVFTRENRDGEDSLRAEADSIGIAARFDVDGTFDVGQRQREDGVTKNSSRDMPWPPTNNRRLTSNVLQKVSIPGNVYDLAVRLTSMAVIDFPKRRMKSTSRLRSNQ